MKFETAIQGWERINSIAPGDLREARLQAHWAVQIIGGAGESLVPHEPDFSHTSMSWLDGLRMLAGQPTPGGFQIALRIEDMTMHVLADGSKPVSSFSLEGKTLPESLKQITSMTEAASASPVSDPPKIPEYEMPDHPVASGDPFHLAPEWQRSELARWYANAARFEEVVLANTPGASPVRCWPHHFDIATLITLDPPAKDPEEARSIGCGLSPGDASCEEPYLYINPWPRPDEPGQPPLGGNAYWHTEGWFGAVLPASRIESADGREQAAQVAEYMASAIEACHAMLRESSG